MQKIGFWPTIEPFSTVVEGTICCGIRVKCIIEYYLDMNIPNPKDTYEFEEILIITND